MSSAFESEHTANGAQPTPSSSLHETRPLYWSIRREVWENRFLYIAPLIVTAFVLFGSFVAIVSMAPRLRAVAGNAAREHMVLVKPFSVAPAPIMFVTFIIGFFYSLDALYGERRDRSILFWKSLPVSDRTTVLSKAAIPFVVLPLIGLALSIATQIVLLMISTPILLGIRINPARVWTELRFFEGLVIMVYGLTVHVLWFAPVYGWLILVSGWARRATFLWAVMPFLAVSAVEKMAFNTMYFIGLLEYRMTGALKEAFVRGGGHGGDFDRLSQLEPGRFLSTPGLWLGLVLACVFLVTAVRLRRNRDPI